MRKSPFSLDKYLDDDNYPANWPPKEYFVNQMHVTDEQLQRFRDLVEGDAGEKAIDEFLRKNLPVLAISTRFNSTGHHGVWIIPQQVIRPGRDQVEHGLKPDYLIGAKNSDGFSWFVLELKASNASVFQEQNGRVFFSPTANRGIFQLLDYVDYCMEINSYLRDTLKLSQFNEPQGILLMGREKEMEEHPYKQRMKSAWNRASGDRLKVRTYDALLREVSHIVEHFDRRKEL